MRNRKCNQNPVRLIRKSVLAAAVAGVVASPGAFAGQSTSPATALNGNNPAVTISLSGSTAMRNFTISTGITFLAPGASIDLANGTGGAITPYLAPGSTVSYQLASDSFGSSGEVTSGNSQNHSAIRLEWHEQGSVEGILDLANDQIGYGTSANPAISEALVTPSTRNPVPSGSTASSNPIWVNGWRWDGTSVSSPAGSHGTGANNHFILGTGPTAAIVLSSSAYNTYSASSYNLATGQNIENGQSRVQMAISDVASLQGFSKSGTGVYSFGTSLNNANYGKGNPALAVATTVSSGTPIAGLGSKGVRTQLTDETSLNMQQTKFNPATGAAYGAGPWNTAGANNLANTKVAVTATLMAANPGTGLEHINRGDAQWLQTTGRLANGADFNVTTRDVNSGTRNVAALNAGVDPSWASGENDGGTGALTESGLVPGQEMKFGNKTAGGGALRPTLRINRMSLGTLGLSDAVGTGVSGANFTKNDASDPIRALAYRDDKDDIQQTTGSTSPNYNGDAHNNWRRVGSGASATVAATAGDPTSNEFIQPNVDSITDGSYVLYQNETYVTVKAPNAAFAGDDQNTWKNRTDTETGIKGDNTHGDVSRVRGNVLSAAVNAPNSTTPATAGDALLLQGFIPQQFMQVKKSFDGVNQTSENNSGAAGTVYDGAKGNLLRTTPGFSQKFDTGVAGTVTTGITTAGGTGSLSISTYGGNGGSAVSSGATFSTSIPINANNYFFGDFRKNATSAGDGEGSITIGGTGVRDYSDLRWAQKAAVLIEGDNNAFSGNSASPTNGNVIINAVTNNHEGLFGTGTYTKGDLIVMGDYNSDGKFDGRDLYLMGRGTTLADSKTSATLGGVFSDSVRDATKTLRKNDALDYLNTNATAAQTTAASSDGGKGFDKFDVNRDGVVNRDDATIVDSFVGKDYRVLDDQLNAVVATSTGNVKGKGFIGAANNPALAINDPNNAAFVARKPISLVDVELNDTGTITHALASGTSDFKLSRDAVGTKLNAGDTNFDNTVDIADFDVVRSNFGGSNKKWSTGDIAGIGGEGDFDGTVTIADFDAIRSHFGGSGTGGGSSLGGAALSTARTATRSTSSAVKTSGASSTIKTLSSVASSAGGGGLNITPAPTPAAPDTVKLVIDRNTGEVMLIGNDADREELTSYQIIDNAKPAGTNGRFNGFVYSHTDNTDPNNPVDVGTALSYKINGWGLLSASDGNLAEGRQTSQTLVGTTGQSIGNIFRIGYPETGLVFTYGALEGGVTEGIQTGVIEFVPEPSSLSLLALGATSLIRRRRRA